MPSHLGRRARCDNQSLSFDYVVIRFERERAAAQVGSIDIGDQKFGAEAGRLIAEFLHQLRPLYAFCKARIILYLCCNHQLPAGLRPFDDKRVKVCAGGINRCGQPGWP